LNRASNVRCVEFVTGELSMVEDRLEARESERGWELVRVSPKPSSELAGLGGALLLPGGAVPNQLERRGGVR